MIIWHRAVDQFWKPRMTTNANKFDNIVIYYCLSSATISSKLIVIYRTLSFHIFSYYMLHNIKNNTNTTITITLHTHKISHYHCHHNHQPKTWINQIKCHHHRRLIGTFLIENVWCPYCNINERGQQQKKKKEERNIIRYESGVIRYIYTTNARWKFNFLS